MRSALIRCDNASRYPRCHSGQELMLDGVTKEPDNASYGGVPGARVRLYSGNKFLNCR